MQVIYYFGQRYNIKNLHKFHTRNNDNCFDCCEGDNCNSLANFAFDEKTKVAGDTDLDNKDKITTVADSTVSQSTDSTISITRQSDSSKSTSTLSADSVSVSSTSDSTTKSNLLDAISKIEAEEVEAKNEEAKEEETKNEDLENENGKNGEIDDGEVKDFKDEEYEDSKDTIEINDDTTSKTSAFVSTDDDKSDTKTTTTAQVSKTSLEDNLNQKVNKLTDELDGIGELTDEGDHDSRKSVEDKFDDSKESMMQDDATKLEKNNLDNDLTSSTAGAEISNSTESTTTTVEPSSGSTLFFHFDVLLISIFIISLC